jgi:hypothetical protein
MGEDDHPVGDTSRPSDGSARATARWGCPRSACGYRRGDRPEVPVDRVPRILGGRHGACCPRERECCRRAGDGGRSGRAPVISIRGARRRSRCRLHSASFHRFGRRDRPDRGRRSSNRIVYPSVVGLDALAHTIFRSAAAPGRTDSSCRRSGAVCQRRRRGRSPGPPMPATMSGACGAPHEFGTIALLDRSEALTYWTPSGSLRG